LAAQVCSGRLIATLDALQSHEGLLLAPAHCTGTQQKMLLWHRFPSRCRGSGKTTLLHLIAGILSPDSGRILFELDGSTTDLVQLTEAQRDMFRGRHIGYVFQTHHLLPGFTGLENVLLGMSFTGRAWNCLGASW
jgi:ABC-type uncharacterized transport system YnjBCD ATPase subunit